MIKKGDVVQIKTWDEMKAMEGVTEYPEWLTHEPSMARFSSHLDGLVSERKGRKLIVPDNVEVDKDSGIGLFKPWCLGGYYIWEWMLARKENGGKTDG